MTCMKQQVNLLKKATEPELNQKIDEIINRQADLLTEIE